MGNPIDGESPIQRDKAAWQLRQMWRQGLRPDVREFLTQTGDLTPSQTVAVLRVDQQERWQLGEKIPAEEYLKLHPTLQGSNEDAIDLVYGEFLLREEVGESPPLDEYLQRFPQYAEQLRLQFDVHQALNTNHSVGSSGLKITPTSIMSSGGAVRPAVPGRPPGKWPSVAGYEILGELGRGGMAIVYKARQIALGRLVALKMIRARDVIDPEEISRLRVEAEAVARLQHPNIVQIYEVGEHDGCPYLALEYVDGGSLAQKLGRKSQPPVQSAQLVESLARAMHYAHARGIVHRDLKPANVMLAHNGTAKITDFGLAKRLVTRTLTFQGAAGSNDPTQTGAILGTPGYMAPEQAGGRTHEVGPAADVYALGAILYEMLTGRPPFHAASPMLTLMQVLHDDPVFPSQVSGQVPRDLETICLACLHKEPVRRYSSAEVLAEDLRRFLQGEPIQARPVGFWERTWMWARRRPAVASLVGVVILSFILGFVGVFWQWQRAEDRAEAETAAKHDAQRERTKAIEAHRGAERARGDAERARSDAETAREDTEVALYFSRVALAEREWLANNVAGAESLLDKCLPAEGRPDPRGWEWYHLKRLCHADVFTQRASNFWVHGVAFSPDGRTIVTAAGLTGGLVGRDPREYPGTLTLWNADTGQEIGTRTQKGTVDSVAFSPDGRWLLWHSADEMWRVLDLRSQGHPREWRAFYVAFAPDSKSFAAAWDNTTIKLFELPTGKEIRTLTGVGGKGSFLVYSPDSRLLAATMENRFIKVHDAATGQEVRSIEVPDGVQSLTFNSDGQRLMSVGKTTRFWNVSTGKEVASLPQGGVLSPDDKHVASWAGDTIVLWNATTGQRLHELRGHNGEVNGIAFSPDGRSLATAGTDQTVRLWDVGAGREYRVYRGHTFGVKKVAFSPDGRRLASASQDGTLKVWDLTQDQRGVQLPSQGHGGEYLYNLSFSADSQELFAVHGYNFARWEVATGKVIDKASPLALAGEWEIPRGDIVFSDGSRWLAAPDPKRKTVKVWDAATRAEKLTLSGHEWPVMAVAISADGSRVASAGWDVIDITKTPKPRRSDRTELKLWDGTTGKELLSFQLDQLVQCMAVSRDGRLLAAAGRAPWTAEDGKSGVAGVVRVWDTMTGQQRFLVAGHFPYISCIAFSPDGKKLASVGFADQQVVIWDAETGTMLKRLQGPRTLTHVAFSPDPEGRRVAAVGYDGIVYLWDTATGEQVLVLRVFGPQRGGDFAYNARVVFSPDGRRLAANHHHGNITIWDATPLEEKAAAEAAEPMK